MGSFFNFLCGWREEAVGHLANFNRSDAIVSEPSRAEIRPLCQACRRDSDSSIHFCRIASEPVSKLTKRRFARSARSFSGNIKASFSRTGKSMSGKHPDESTFQAGFPADFASGCPDPTQKNGPSAPCGSANPVGRDQLPVCFGIPPLEERAMQGDLEEKGGGPDHSEKQAAEEECI